MFMKERGGDGGRRYSPIVCFLIWYIYQISARISPSRGFIKERGEKVGYQRTIGSLISTSVTEFQSYFPQHDNTRK